MTELKRYCIALEPFLSSHACVLDLLFYSHYTKCSTHKKNEETMRKVWISLIEFSVSVNELIFHKHDVISQLKFRTFERCKMNSLVPVYLRSLLQRFRPSWTRFLNRLIFKSPPCFTNVTLFCALFPISTFNTPCWSKLLIMIGSLLWNQYL